MSKSINRRELIGGAATASAAACLVGTVTGGTNVAANEPNTNVKTLKRRGEWPRWDETDEAILLEVLNSGQWGRTGGGIQVPKFEAVFAQRMKAKYCIATSAGTTALLTTFGALGIGPGDEVILPPYTFVATFNAITCNYALPVFVDSDIETFQIDPTKIKAKINANTKLLLPVHIGGSPADMTAVNAVGKEHSIAVIEDACQAPLAELRGQPVGTHGLAGCISPQATKNLNSGEGGAVLTNDEPFANLCFDFHTPGGTKKSPSTGRGANYRLTEFQAGLLLSQYSRLEEQAKLRDANATYLTELLQTIPGISPARLVDGCTRSAWHLYMWRYDKDQFAGLTRTKFLAALSKSGVGASSGYTPLNSSSHVRALATNPHYQRIYGKEAMRSWLDANQCPVNDRLCEQAVWLGQSTLLGTRDDMEKIAETISKVQKNAGDLVRTF